MSRAERLACIERDGSDLPLTVQADLLSISRRSLYYQPKGPSQEGATSIANATIGL